MLSDSFQKYDQQSASFQVMRINAPGQQKLSEDILAIEEPLEIRVAGEPVAITMRTPGTDRALALGFLYSEHMINTIEDVGRVGHCGRPGFPDFGNVIDVLPAPGRTLNPEQIRAARRGTLTSSACGLCGRERIDDLLQHCQPLVDEATIDGEQIPKCQTLMRASQEIFAQTGGVHAAAAFALSGKMLACFEDVGRHNAVDKVVGCLLENYDLQKKSKIKILTVSSRASFEIVQKAVVARIPVVVAVSAASSLAVELARAMGITLIGFARNNCMVIYTGFERIV
ncbi:MAG: formate dehydrogenase accessory sulfurtransferase FdhD [Candidatus Latescibacteria bacterium]|nr:formate dehydrogenase accessory sulfurtransferase FdhD [Candidatus Latescibacterota bacterium]